MKTRPTGTPLVPTITFATASAFPTAAAMREAGARPGSSELYARWDNETVMAAERAIAEMEGAERTIATASGMAAIHIALVAALNRDPEAISTLLMQREVYGATHELVHGVLGRMGVQIQTASVDDLVSQAATLSSGAVIYLELPTNPLLRVVDLEAVRRAAPADTVIIMDATFATPINIQPLSRGADLVVHSATKYLAGHHDVLAGVVSGNGDLIERVWRTRKLLGPTLDPSAAYRLIRGLETLALRVERQNHTAEELARDLQRHPRVRRVIHPSLDSHPDSGVARRLMTGFGGVLSLEVEGGQSGACHVIDHVTQLKRAASLGGVCSLITWPAGVTHVGLSDRERQDAGIAPGLLRLALGIEPIETLRDDLINALDKTV